MMLTLFLVLFSLSLNAKNSILKNSNLTFQTNNDEEDHSKIFKFGIISQKYKKIDTKYYTTFEVDKNSEIFAIFEGHVVAIDEESNSISIQYTDSDHNKLIIKYVGLKKLNVRMNHLVKKSDIIGFSISDKVSVRAKYNDFIITLS